MAYDSHWQSPSILDCLIRLFTIPIDLTLTTRVTTFINTFAFSVFKFVCSQVISIATTFTTSPIRSIAAFAYIRGLVRVNNVNLLFFYPIYNTKFNYVQLYSFTYLRILLYPQSIHGILGPYLQEQTALAPMSRFL